MSTQLGRHTAVSTDDAAGPDVTAAPHAAPLAPRSRRSILAAALGGVAATVAGALGRPAPAAGAAGDSLKIGLQNFAGSAATRLSATSSGGAFWMTQNGSGSAVRGDSANGHGGVFTSGHMDRFGISATNTGPNGNGAAIRGDGADNNDGISASASAFLKAAVRATHTGAGYAVLGTATGGEAVGVRGYAPNGIGVQGMSDTMFAGSFIGHTYFNGYLEITETTTPGSVTGRVRLFARDSGGHTQLVAKFQDGTEVVLGASIDADT